MGIPVEEIDYNFPKGDYYPKIVEHNPQKQRNYLKTCRYSRPTVDVQRVPD